MDIWDSMTKNYVSNLLMTNDIWRIEFLTRN